MYSLEQMSEQTVLFRRTFILFDDFGTASRHRVVFALKTKAANLLEKSVSSFIYLRTCGAKIINNFHTIVKIVSVFKKLIFLIQTRLSMFENFLMKEIL